MKSEKVQRDWHHVMEEVIGGTDILVERYNKPIFALINFDLYLAFLQYIADYDASHQADIIREMLHSGKLTATEWRDLKSHLAEES